VSVVVRAHQQQARQLTGRPGCGLQSGGLHPGDRAEALLELDEELEPALGARSRSSRVDLCEARERRTGVGGLRVVLHRARTEWVRAEIDRVLAVSEACEVRDEVTLGDFRQRH
jgi:hypothetical protein